MPSSCDFGRQGAKERDASKIKPPRGCTEQTQSFNLSLQQEYSKAAEVDINKQTP
jgi:hypothetical protein